MERCRNSGESWRVQLGERIERNWKMTNTETGAARKQFARAAYKKRRRSISMPFSTINQSGSLSRQSVISFHLAFANDPGQRNCPPRSSSISFSSSSFADSFID